MVLVEVERNQNIELNVNVLTGCYVILNVFWAEARFSSLYLMMLDGQRKRTARGKSNNYRTL